MSKRKELIEKVKKDKFEKDERNQIILILEQSKDLVDFHKKAEVRLNIIEESDPELRFKIDAIIRDWMNTNKPEWYEQYENPYFDKNPMEYLAKLHDLIKLEIEESGGEYPKYWIPDEPPRFELESTIKRLRQEIRKFKEDRILLLEEIIRKNERIIKLSSNKIESERLKKDNVKLKNQVIVLDRENEGIKKQRGTINQYFPEWESETISLHKNMKKNFYETEFSKNKPDLKIYPYKNFSQNFRTNRSNKLKAIRNIK